MPDSAYLRKQADTCRRLAGTILDCEAQQSLRAMATEYERQADKLEAEGKPPAPEK